MIKIKINNDQKNLTINSKEDIKQINQFIINNRNNKKLGLLFENFNEYDDTLNKYSNYFKRIHFKSCNLNYDNLSQFIHIFEPKSLTFTGCNMNTKDLLDVMYQNSTLKSLNLYENNFKCNTYELIYIITNSNLQYLNVLGQWYDKQIIKQYLDIPLEERNVPLNSNSKSAAKNN